MEIIVVGVNHKAAPVAVREMLAFTPVQMEAAMAALREATTEGVLLSTCNRTEIYAVVPSAEEGRRQIMDFLAGFHGAPVARFTPYLFSLVGREAVAHLFSVASGLESMILGEPQILGQVRGAYAAAAARSSAGPILSWVFLHSLKTGKRVRTDTGISRNAASISHAAVELARKELGTLAGRRVVLIGAGEMAELAARNLVDNGCADLVVANRTHERAVALASSYGGSAAEFDRLPRLLAEADIAITCTGAPTYVVSQGMVKEAMQVRPDRSLFLIDIAVPRDVEPEVRQIPNVLLHDIDDLQSLRAANLEERRREAAAAERIVESELDAFDHWWSSLQVVPTIRALRDRADEIRQVELQKALGRLGGLSDHQRSAVEALAAGIVNKILHQPTVRLKDCCAEYTGATYALTLRELFGLEDCTETVQPELQEQSVG
jgi:glutamyl-tRNA reductase